jgi:hypothetical protein
MENVGETKIMKKMKEIAEIEMHEFQNSVRKPIPFIDNTEVNNLLSDNDIEKANSLLNDIENNPHAFVLGCLMDRQIKADKAWSIPQIVFNELKTFDINELAKKSLKEYKNIFCKKESKLHRYDYMVEIFYDGVQDIKTKYQGDASKIWRGKPISALVVRKFREFKGCGIKISTMAANILARQFKIEFADYCFIDISPDTHVMRVMERMGCVSKDASREMVIYKAREIYPEFPGIIDLFLFNIGRNLCHPQNPNCDRCQIKTECEKNI